MTLALIIFVAFIAYGLGRSQQAWRDVQRKSKRRRPEYLTDDLIREMRLFDDQQEPRLHGGLWRWNP